ncbi:MAG: YdcF family protein [Alphaproteobacteria bacterium]|nr:YdcF family protein [Alphaproteobacteria bacterium]
MQGLIPTDFLLPPTGLILLAAAGAWLTLWHPRVGLGIAMIVATSLLYLAALPAVSARMMEDVEIAVPDNPDFAAARAIVVLGGGVHRGDGEMVPDTLGLWSLQRVYFGAQAYRRLRLKVAVSGGRVGGAHVSEASLMKAALEQDFAVPVSWAEDGSRATWENARNTAELLKPLGIGTIVLVTHAWHLRRAMWAFERAGLHAVPWPTPRTYDDTDRLDDYVPSTGALLDSYHALHEAIGLAYYRLRY